MGKNPKAAKSLHSKPLSSSSIGLINKGLKKKKLGFPGVC